MLIDDLKSRFPDIDTAVIDKYFPLYETSYICYYNAKYGVNRNDNEIILHLLAHLITVSNDHSDGSTIHQIGGESVGGVSVSYVETPIDNNDKFFISTIYGQTYKLLIKNNSRMYFV